MRNLYIIFLLTITLQSTYGQSCGLVSGTKDKKSGIETKGGVVNSKDYYSLLIQKTLTSNDTLNYRFFLNAASRVMLSDSMLKSKGIFELLLINGEKIVINNAECQNDPLGFGASIGFSVNTNEKVIEQLIQSPIKKIKVFDILETEFAPRKQQQLQRILTCLKNEK